jgi:hypothetical protein
MHATMRYLGLHQGRGRHQCRVCRQRQVGRQRLVHRQGPGRRRDLKQSMAHVKWVSICDSKCLT